MHRLVYLCDWLPPDFGAVGQYSLLFARERAAAGEDVVLAGLSSTAASIEEERPGRGPAADRPPGGRHLRPLRLQDAGRSGRRAPTSPCSGALRRELRRADEILFTGSPPFLIHLLVPLNLLLRKRLTYRITDFHPECLMAEMGPPEVPLPLRLFHRWTVFLRRRIDRFEVLGEDQRERPARDRHPPGPDRPQARPVARGDPAGRRAPARPSRGAAPAGWSSSTPATSAWPTTTRRSSKATAATTARAPAASALWLNATGAKADRVEEILRREGLPVHRSRPVPLDLLPRLLVTPDAHLITLRDEFVGYVLPSKVYGCVQSGRPVLFVGQRPLGRPPPLRRRLARRLPPRRRGRRGGGGRGPGGACGKHNFLYNTPTTIAI